MANGLPISKENFRKLESSEAKLDALYDAIVPMYEDVRLLKTHKRFDRFCASVVGGASAALIVMGDKILGR